MPKIMKLIDVARHLNVPRRTLYDMIQRGDFAVNPIPNTQPRRWNFDDVEAWRKSGIANQQVSGG